MKICKVCKELVIDKFGECEETEEEGVCDQCAKNKEIVTVTVTMNVSRIAERVADKMNEAMNESDDFYKLCDLFANQLFGVESITELVDCEKPRDEACGAAINAARSLIHDSL